MDTARQVLRFSIPGMLFVLVAVVAQAALNILWHGQAQDMFGAVEHLSVLIIGSTIPVGFVLYQLYFAGYGPIRSWCSLPTRDRGADVLRTLEPAQLARLQDWFGVQLAVADISPRLTERDQARRLLPQARRWAAHLLLTWPLKLLRPLVLEHSCPEDPELGVEAEAPAATPPPSRGASTSVGEDTWGEWRRAYEQRWEDNWNVVMACLDGAGPSGEMPGCKHEYTALSDLYHALGVSRTAMWAALGFTVIYNVSAHADLLAAEPAGVAVTFGSVVALVLGAYCKIHQARRSTLERMLSRLGLNLRGHIA